jgi:multicomponent Na+:H+ antiporter subunit F
MSSFFHWCIIISLALLTLSSILVFIRLLIGPSLPDRVAALDVLAMLIISLITIFAVITQDSLYLDIVIALALVTFLGTVAFAQFIEFQLSHSKVKDDEQSQANEEQRND